MRAGEAKLLAHEIGEREADFDFFVLVALAVDRDGDGAGFPHARPPTRFVRGHQRAARHDGGQMLAVGRGRMHVGEASSLRHSSQASRKTSSDAVWPSSAFSTFGMRTGVRRRRRGQRHALDLAVRIFLEERCRRCDGEIAVAAREFDEAVAVARLGQAGKRMLDQDFVGLDRGRHVVDGKIGDRDVALALRAGGGDGRIERGATVGISADGSRWQSEPPTVPRLRVWRWPTFRIASWMMDGAPSRRRRIRDRAGASSRRRRARRSPRANRTAPRLLFRSMT